MLGKSNRSVRRPRLYLAWGGLFLIILSFVWLQLLTPDRKAQPEIQIAPARKTFALVILDPGHGGQDSGTLNGALAEKDLALDVANRLDRLLQNQGVNTMFTRTNDTYV